VWAVICFVGGDILCVMWAVICCVCGDMLCGW